MMKILYYIIRGLLALQFVWAGIEKLFLPFKTPQMGAAQEFYLILHHTGYLYFVGFFQLLCGILLIFKRAYLLGAIMLVPLILCLLATHIFISGMTGYMIYDTVLLLLDVLLVMSCYKRLLTIFF